MYIDAGFAALWSGLYALQDFAWMAKVSLACFFVFFVPAAAMFTAWSESAMVAVLCHVTLVARRQYLRNARILSSRICSRVLLMKLNGAMA